MGIWSQMMEKLRLRSVLSDQGPDLGEEREQMRVRRPRLTPTERVPERPQETPSARPREIDGSTAGTRSYGSQGGTPSTRRIHNPTHFR
jgi:hypothetical protein